MELFSEIYSTYYHAVGHVLREASVKPLAIRDIQRILTEHSFSESAYHILPKLQNGDWPLLKATASGYTAAVGLLTENPLTSLQLAWLKAIMSDPRVRLFFDEDEYAGLDEALSSGLPLYDQEDFYIFDKARDGDGFGSAQYQSVFRVFLNAIRQKSAVSVQYEGGKGRRSTGDFWPYKLEYSSRDDKFRALCYRITGTRKIQVVLNLGRVVSAREASVQRRDTWDITAIAPKTRFCEVLLEITKERNALERCMVQFAHFEKRTEYDESTDRYTCTIKYNTMDETELVIRVLSFGPTVRVLGPERFISEIKARVEKQTELLRPRLTAGSMGTEGVYENPEE